MTISFVSIDDYSIRRIADAIPIAPPTVCGAGGLYPGIDQLLRNVAVLSAQLEELRNRLAAPRACEAIELTTRALRAALAGLEELAVVDLRESIRCDPYQVRARLAAAYLLQSSDPEEAKVHFRWAYRLGAVFDPPAGARAALAACEFLDAIGRPDEAEAALAEAKQVLPFCASVHLALVAHTLSADDLNELVDRAPRYAGAHVNRPLGDAVLLNSDWKRAIDTAVQAVSALGIDTQGRIPQPEPGLPGSPSLLQMTLDVLGNLLSEHGQPVDLRHRKRDDLHAEADSAAQEHATNGEEDTPASTRTRKLRRVKGGVALEVALEALLDIVEHDRDDLGVEPIAAGLAGV